MGEESVLVVAGGVASGPDDGVCSVEVGGGLPAFLDELTRAFGEEATRQLVAQCAARSAETSLHAATEAGAAPVGEDAISEYLRLAEKRGFGRLRIVEHDWGRGWLVVTAEDSFEAKARLKQGGPSSALSCDVLRGLLAGAYRYARRRDGHAAGDVVAVETRCAAQGHPECRFAVGIAEEVRAHGIEPPSESVASRAELEEALRRSREAETQLREFMEAMPVGVANLDIEGKILAGNRKVLDLVGLPHPKVRGAHFLAFVHPDDRDAVQAGFQKVVEGNADQYPIECRIVDAKGETRRCAVDAFPVLDGGGKPVGYQGIVLDMSDRVRVASGQRLEIALREGSTPSMEMDPEGRIRFCSLALAGLLGIDADGLKGVSLDRFLVGKGAGRAYAAFLAVAAGRRPCTRDLWEVAAPGGGRREIAVFVAPCGPVGSRIDRIVAMVCGNVTGERPVETGLAGLAESQNVWVVVCDPQGNVTALSRAYEDGTGFERATRIGQPVAALLARGGEEAAAAFAGLGDMDGKPRRIRLPFLMQDGDPCAVDLECAALHDASGTLLGVIGVGPGAMPACLPSGMADRRAAATPSSPDEPGAGRAGGRNEDADFQGQALKRRGLDNMIGRNDKMRGIFETVLTVGGTQATVLVQGETGTGKELVAKAVHDNSTRRDRPFVKVDCGALAENLLESELFGHVKGAFTGAVRDRAGRFELAHEGTIFLDEIHNLSIPLQAKLLRVVQDGCFEKVGGTKTHEVNVRIVAATNEDLGALVSSGRFRKDLYYRLNVIPIRLPALRDRRVDIPLLARSFVRRFAERHGKEVVGLSKGALDRLVSYDWPGNVRELENVVEQTVVFCPGQMIRAEDVRLPETAAVVHGGGLRRSGALPLREALEDPEKEILLDAIAQAGGVKKRAARALGISRSALYEKLKRHGLSAKR